MHPHPLNMQIRRMGPTLIPALVFCLITFQAHTAPPARTIFAIRVYQLKTAAQEARIHNYLEHALVPALHRLGLPQVGVFSAIDNDTAAIRRVYVLMPFGTLDQFQELPGVLARDTQYLREGKDYLDAPYDDPPYQRMESILLYAFPEMPMLRVPSLTGPRSERVYELRSYESPTEKLHVNKVRMFNEGGEVNLFSKLGFNAIFYGSVISGSHMPNLMYMTSFDNKASRDAHWKTFSDDPFWKALSASPEYQHNVSKVEITFLRPTEYSDL